MNSEWFVGGLAVLMATAVAYNAVSFSPALYELRSISAIRVRFGRKAACGVLLGLSALLAIAGVMILTGIRPEYAIPSVADEPTDGQQP